MSSRILFPRLGLETSERSTSPNAIRTSWLGEPQRPQLRDGVPRPFHEFATSAASLANGVKAIPGLASATSSSPAAATSRSTRRRPSTHSRASCHLEHAGRATSWPLIQSQSITPFWLSEVQVSQAPAHASRSARGYRKIAAVAQETSVWRSKFYTPRAASDSISQYPQDSTSRSKLACYLAVLAFVR